MDKLKINLLLPLDMNLESPASRLEKKLRYFISKNIALAILGMGMATLPAYSAPMVISASGASFQKRLKSSLLSESARLFSLV